MKIHIIYFKIYFKLLGNMTLEIIIIIYFGFNVSHHHHHSHQSLINRSGLVRRKYYLLS
jgi:hypothetical protein